MKRQNSPLAIIGMSCHFPGGSVNYTKFWDILRDGADAIIDVPETRWSFKRFYDSNQDKPGKMYVIQGGFLKESIDEFDPLAFNISPREASYIDPQQRLLLEQTWHAVEDAGLQFEKLKGSNTGVFIGGFCLDNKLIQLSALNREGIRSHTPTSSTMAIMSNRISYVFDLKGPSITVDTACSSSLVSFHLACQSIWSGESELAISGGANVMLSPEYPIAMSKGKFLSIDGRCKAFDESANGYARGEGVGVVIIKPLDKAIKDKDRIHACVLATGVNQDGATTGISFPNINAQIDLERTVYEKAGIDLSDMGYIEAHGTGTQAGDVTELKALNQVFSSSRKNKKLYVGSVKTNIGHLEAAAGVASIIKSTLLLKHNMIVPSLHFKSPNPGLNYDELCLEVPTKCDNWPNAENKLIGINSFGYGGTNAHVVLKEAPKIIKTAYVEDTQKLSIFCLSAHDEKVLRNLAESYSAALSASEASFNDVIYSAVCRRSHLKHKLAIVSNSIEDIAAKLLEFSKGVQSQNLFYAEQNLKDLVFVYTGMGPQWYSMGKQLYHTYPVFKGIFDEIDRTYKEISGYSLSEKLFDETKDGGSITDASIAQPANVMLQIALTELLKSYGIKPAAIVGHSVGEIPASYVSGSLSLRDVLLVSYHRSRLQQTLSDTGGMLAVGENATEIEKVIQQYGGQVSIAAINSNTSVTLAGDLNALNKLFDYFTEKQIFVRFLKVNIPYHSAIMNAIESELKQSLIEIKPRKNHTTLYSTVVGAEVNGEELDADYWWRNVRFPVKFSEAINQILASGFRCCIEIGAHPVLRNSITEIFYSSNIDGQLIQTLNKKSEEEIAFLNCLSHLYCLGFPVKLDYCEEANYIDLPFYRWQKERYWHESLKSLEYRIGHPEKSAWFDTNLRLPWPAWQVELNSHFFPYINDHVVQGSIVFPGAGYVDAVLALAEDESEEIGCVLENITFHSMLIFNPNDTQLIQLHYKLETSEFSIQSAYSADELNWICNASGQLHLPKGSSGFLPKTFNLQELKDECEIILDVNDQYEILKAAELEYGSCFQPIIEWRLGGDRALSKLSLNHQLLQETSIRPSPTIIDAGFQSIMPLVLQSVGANTTYVPVSIRRLCWYKAFPRCCWVYATLTKKNHTTLEANLDFIDAEGEVLLSIEGASFKPILKEKKSIASYLYQQTWIQDDFDFSQVSYSIRESSCLIISDKNSSKVQKLIKEYLPQAFFVTEGVDFSRDDMKFKLCFYDYSHWEKLFSLISVTHIVLVCHSTENGDVDQVLKQVWPISHMIKACEAINKLPQSLTVLTKSAQSVDMSDTITDLSCAPLWGVLPLISNEYPKIKTYLIDIDEVSSLEECDYDIFYKSTASLIALRKGKRYIKTLINADEDEISSKNLFTKNTDQNAIHIGLDGYGSTSNIVFFEYDRRDPGPGEVEIQVYSSALNFKDILKIYNQLPEHVILDTFFGSTLGMEVSGVITKVGEGVSGFQAGDKVITPVKNAFCSFATVPTTYVIPKPSTLDFHEAPVMIGYLAAYYGLEKLAHLQEGEKVLIHAATGGVGIAAIQIAKWRRAEIYATAGTDEKRDYLKSLGIKNIYDSRTTKFFYEILSETNGYGVDVIISAISGYALFKSIDLLSPNGRFIEIGKKDIASNSKLPMHVFNKGLMFASVDIDRMLLNKPRVIQGLLREISEHFESGNFQPMPIKVFPFSDAQSAFDLLSTGKHIGKIVLSLESQEVKVRRKALLAKNSAYLVVGGTSGFGLHVGKWLADNGAGQVILSSRSADINSIPQDVVEYIQKRCNLKIEKVDVQERSQVQSLIDSIHSSEYTLKGMIHSAMVLDDDKFSMLTLDRYKKVLSPKINGALNLIDSCLEVTLDFFVVFSSVSSIVGNPGQANYIVANSFLDALPFAHKEKRISVINWGALAEAGVVARDEKIAKMLSLFGVSGISNEVALSALELAIRSQLPQIGVFDIDWKLWAKNSKYLSCTQYFSKLVSKGCVQGSGAASDQVIQELLLIPKEERSSFVLKKLKEQVSKVLKLSEEKISDSSGIDTLGIDSLVAIELVTLLRRQLSVELTTMDLLKGYSLTQLANIILNQLLERQEFIVEEIDSLSEEELDIILSEAEPV